MVETPPYKSLCKALVAAFPLSRVIVGPDPKTNAWSLTGHLWHRDADGHGTRSDYFMYLLRITPSSHGGYDCTWTEQGDAATVLTTKDRYSTLNPSDAIGWIGHVRSKLDCKRDRESWEPWSITFPMPILAALCWSHGLIEGYARPDLPNSFLEQIRPGEAVYTGSDSYRYRIVILRAGDLENPQAFLLPTENRQKVPTPSRHLSQTVRFLNGSSRLVERIEKAALTLTQALNPTVDPTAPPLTRMIEVLKGAGPNQTLVISPDVAQALRSHEYERPLDHTEQATGSINLVISRHLPTGTVFLMNS